MNEGGLVAKLGSAVENISEKPVIQPISRHTDHHPEPSNRYSVMVSEIFLSPVPPPLLCFIKFFF